MTNSISLRSVVDVRALENGAYRSVARVTWDGSTVTVEGEQDLVAEIRDGLVFRPTGRRVVPADGQPFLAAVLDQYQSPYLLATFVPPEQP